MPRGVGLSRQRVLDLAQHIADTEGAAALDLTRLAREAGVRKPSLYKHVEGLPDILSSLTLRAYEALVETLEDHVGDHRGDPQSVRVMARRWREWGIAHPGLYVIAARTHVDGPPEVQVAGARLLSLALDHLQSLGMSETEALHAARSLRALVHGYVVLEVSRGFGVDVDVAESFDHGVEAIIRGWRLAARAD